MATPAIVRIGPVPRQEGLQTPDLLVPAQWVDAIVLAAGVAETYTLPTDAAGQHGSILRLSSASAGTFYFKWDGVAAVPAADVADGTSSFGARLDNERLVLAAPRSSYALSIINAAAAVLTIEVWN